MDGAIFQNVPWFLILLASAGALWLGLRLGVRYHATLANMPLIGVNASNKTDERLDRLEALIEKLANK